MHGWSVRRFASIDLNSVAVRLWGRSGSARTVEATARGSRRVGEVDSRIGEGFGGVIGVALASVCVVEVSCVLDGRRCRTYLKPNEVSYRANAPLGRLSHSWLVPHDSRPRPCRTLHTC
ncbi:hypothetical protein CC78DRAFT_322269 [Lojkania enalia]|uniref:Uncharacterized protein n=1 Tax=Lojkania enalia TaxID=147567 RepID=A0A9P4K3H8_9PLEO|nr:hypothetical protein CC78DRAFT_322269 [Didymosphaeria enalia]